MEKQIKKKERARPEIEVFLIAQFGWFLFSSLTEASETDQFLLTHKTTKHTQACTSMLLRAFTVTFAVTRLTPTFTYELNLSLTVTPTLNPQAAYWRSDLTRCNKTQCRKLKLVLVSTHTRTHIQLFLTAGLLINESSCSIAGLLENINLYGDSLF